MMDNSKSIIEKLKEQKKILETVIANPPQTQEQFKVIREAKNHLEKINNLLKIFGEQR